jgi:septum formation protein
MAHQLDLVLASGSPRRRELLGLFGLPFRIVVTDAEEEEHAPEDIRALLPDIALTTHDHPTLRAWRKAVAACTQAPDSVIIAADTVVVLDGDVLNKPADAADARSMLRRLSGREHRVYTGLALLDTRASAHEPYLQLEIDASQVQIAPLTDAAIAAYVATGEPLDKAGAYGIQGIGGTLVQSVAGSYTCVVGLPIVKLHQLLVARGIATRADPYAIYQRWLRDQGKDALPCPPTFP